jgi:hypothetical protein
MTFLFLHTLVWIPAWYRYPLARKPRESVGNYDDRPAHARTGGALVAVNGVIIWIQGRRRSDDIRRREKDNRELLLGQKAEEYYLSATKAMR